PTNTPTKTPTPITPTNPPATATNTPGNPGSTDVSPSPTTAPSNTPTTTPIPPTNTPVPPTNTPAPPTATSTPFPPATIKIHIRDSAGNALDGATIQVQGPSGTSSVTDNGAGDGDATAGEILLSNLSAGGYLGTQSAAKSGYFVDTHSESSSL